MKLTRRDKAAMYLALLELRRSCLCDPAVWNYTYLRNGLLQLSEFSGALDDLQYYSGQWRYLQDHDHRTRPFRARLALLLRAMLREEPYEYAPASNFYGSGTFEDDRRRAQAQGWQHFDDPESDAFWRRPLRYVALWELAPPYEAP